MSPSQSNQVQIEVVGFILEGIKILISCGNQVVGFFFFFCDVFYLARAPVSSAGKS